MQEEIDFLAVINYNEFSDSQKVRWEFMSQMGRPKSDNPKSEKVTVRLDKEHSQILKEYCEKEKVDKAEAVRQGIRKLKE